MRKYLILFSFLFCFLIVSAAQAQERILLFRSEISINTDGSMEVKEAIIINSEGRQFKRGIYRDFPTRYKDRLGNDYRVDFQVISLQRDGINDTYHMEQKPNGERIYIGRKNYFISAGEHTYIITYRTNRQLGFFKDFDELYWNVTGNGWNFIIEKAEAKVILPSDAQEHIISDRKSVV